jgi:hypothetical protein
VKTWDCNIRNAKNPGSKLPKLADPGIELYKDRTSSWGPPMRVVPVSMADKGLVVESVTAAPLTVIPDKG